MGYLGVTTGTPQHDKVWRGDEERWVQLSRSSSLFKAGVLLAGVVVFGTLAYAKVEGWTWFDSLYMTITTITTVGGGEPRPMDVAGKWLTIVIVAVGFAALTYTVLRLMAYMVEGRLDRLVGERRTRRRIAKMQGHYILCGYGRVGREIARLFTEEKKPFLIIDINQDSLDRAEAEGYIVVHGDAAETSTLHAAGIERAAGLIAAVDSDENNIYLTLSARVLNPKLFIVARANRDHAEEKLRLAGANRIISPYAMGGRRMASLAMRPTAVEFVDTVLSASNAELLLEDFAVTDSSKSRGRTLEELIPAESSMIVLALKRGGRMTFRPSRDSRLESGDEIVVAGSPEDMRSLELGV
jgi:voltage-gated potassium channel